MRKTKTVVEAELLLEKYAAACLDVVDDRDLPISPSVSELIRRLLTEHKRMRSELRGYREGRR